MSVNPEPAPTPPPPPASIEPVPGTRLADLLARYDDLKDREDALKAEVKDLTDAIKLEASQQKPDAARIDLSSGSLRTPLRLSYVESWRVDSKRLKAENPLLYVQYAKKSGAWKLERSRSD